MARIEIPSLAEGVRIRALSNVSVDVSIVGAGPFNVRTISAALPAGTVLAMNKPPRRGDIWGMRPEQYAAVAPLLIPDELLTDPKFRHYDIYAREHVLVANFERVVD